MLRRKVHLRLTEDQFSVRDSILAKFRNIVHGVAFCGGTMTIYSSSKGWQLGDNTYGYKRKRIKYVYELDPRDE